MSQRRVSQPDARKPAARPAHAVRPWPKCSGGGPVGLRGVRIHHTVYWNRTWRSRATIPLKQGKSNQRIDLQGTSPSEDIFSVVVVLGCNDADTKMKKDF